MKQEFSELPGWTFEIEESAGGYHIAAMEKGGQTFDMTGPDRDLLLIECREVAAALSEQAQFERP